MADTRTEFRAFAKTSLNLDPDNPGSRTRLDVLSDIAAMVDVWEAAFGRKAALDKRQTEIRSAGMAVELSRGEALQLRTLVQDAIGKFPDAEAPGPSYLEMKLTELQDGEYRYCRWKYVLSVEEDEGDQHNFTFDRAGRPIWKKSAPEGRAPAGSEDLRARMLILAHAHMYVMMRHQHRNVLKGLTMADFERHVAYILGDQVANIRGD